MKEKILELLMQESLTLPELRDVIGESAKGSMEAVSLVDRNIVFCRGCSYEFIRALRELQAEKLLHLGRIPRFEFFILSGERMGCIPDAKRPPEDGYRRRHFLPVVVCYGPGRRVGQEIR